MKKRVKHLPAVQSILDGAKKKTAALREAIDAHKANIEKTHRAYAAWAKVANFPNSIVEAEHKTAHVQLILALGNVLKTNGWQARIDELDPGLPEKQIAVEMLRCALFGDEQTLSDLLQQCVDGGELAYDADNWLRLGLMKEMLRITEPAAKPDQADSNGGGQPNPFKGLREFAAANLKGIGRRIIELICERGGSCPLPELASDQAIKWDIPCDDAFNSAKKRINAKLKKTQWNLYRHDGKATVKHVGRK